MSESWISAILQLSVGRYLSSVSREWYFALFMTTTVLSSNENFTLKPFLEVRDVHFVMIVGSIFLPNEALTTISQKTIWRTNVVNDQPFSTTRRDLQTTFPLRVRNERFFLIFYLPYKLTRIVCIAPSFILVENSVTSPSQLLDSPEILIHKFPISRLMCKSHEKISSK